MNIFRLLFIALISGLIGYITNVLAIRRLFRPYKKVKIGPIYFQGLIAKRKEDIAKSVADTVTRDLVDREDLIGQLIK
ncbi:DUF445 domain-containing protein [Peptoniphilus catoniae]|uniref:DUF445 domain-containing protein n=1 Tax=Peptoniphilus catoniae TaxID=1660341 RepID=UPI0010FDC6A9|nr:DUF445 family protein [Peptoniphilus catoniae]